MRHGLTMTLLPSGTKTARGTRRPQGNEETYKSEETDEIAAILSRSSVPDRWGSTGCLNFGRKHSMRRARPPSYRVEVIFVILQSS